jgi:hypothetical protein
MFFYSRLKYVKGKRNGKFLPVNVTKAYMAAVFLTPSHKTEVTVPSLSPVALPRWRSPLCWLNKRFGGHLEKTRSLARYVIEFLTLQLVSSSLCSVRYAGSKFIIWLGSVQTSNRFKSQRVRGYATSTSPHILPHAVQITVAVTSSVSLV